MNDSRSHKRLSEEGRVDRDGYPIRKERIRLAPRFIRQPRNDDSLSARGIANRDLAAAGHRLGPQFSYQVAAQVRHVLPGHPRWKMGKPGDPPQLYYEEDVPTYTGSGTSGEFLDLDLEPDATATKTFPVSGSSWEMAGRIELLELAKLAARKTVEAAARHEPWALELHQRTLAAHRIAEGLAMFKRILGDMPQIEKLQFAVVRNLQDPQAPSLEQSFSDQQLRSASYGHLPNRALERRLRREFQGWKRERERARVLDAIRATETLSLRQAAALTGINKDKIARLRRLYT